MTTDIPPTGGLLVTSIFLGAVSSRACSGACKCCTGMAQSQGQHTLWGNSSFAVCHASDCSFCLVFLLAFSCVFAFSCLVFLVVLCYCASSFCMVLLLGCFCVCAPFLKSINARRKSPALILSLGHAGCKSIVSQRSLHNAPIFRLLLKVAVNGTHQCESLNFCGALRPNSTSLLLR